TILAMVVSFFCMAQSLRTLPMGTVYAAWTGIGAAGGMIWGIAIFGEPATAARIICEPLIPAVVIGLRLGSVGRQAVQPRTPSRAGLKCYGIVLSPDPTTAGQRGV